MKNKLFALMATTTILTAALPAAAQSVIFNGGTPTNTTFRSANSGPGQSIAVTTNTTLTNIGFYSASPNGGNLKYLIFDAAGDNLLFSITAAATNTSATAALIASPTFSFNLAAGSTYQFGLISDSALNVGFDTPPSFVAMNGLTSVGVNHNYSSYAMPVSAGDAAASIPLVLYGFQSAVPEPASWAMMILGMGVVGYALRRKVRVSEVKFDAKIKRISEGATA